MTYTGIPEYRFVIVNFDLYIVDTPDYDSGDVINGYLNDVQELIIYGKNFSLNEKSGSSNLCG